FPFESTVEYEITPKMSFEEYLSLAASVISLWFGFSIIMFAKSLREILIKFEFKKYAQQLVNPIINNYNNYNVNCNLVLNVRDYIRNKNRIISINTAWPIMHLETVYTLQ